MNEGTYYPAASLYTMPEQEEGATVTFNFGMHRQAKPLSTVVPQHAVTLQRMLRKAMLLCLLVHERLQDSFTDCNLSSCFQSHDSCRTRSGMQSARG